MAETMRTRRDVAMETGVFGGLGSAPPMLSLVGGVQTIEAAPRACAAVTAVSPSPPTGIRPGNAGPAPRRVADAVL